jgi:glycosyltransferase involved in cell wall biosynthesis
VTPSVIPQTAHSEELAFGRERSRPLRVLYCAHTLALGGSAASLAALIAHIPAGEVEAHLLAVPGPAMRSFEPIVQSTETIPSFVRVDSLAGAPLRGRRLLTLLRALPALRYASRLKQAIKRVNPDIVHLNERGMLHAAFVASRCGVPVVMHARAVADRSVGWHRRLTLRVVSRCVARVIAIDESVRHSLRELPRCEVVYNPLRGSAAEPREHARGLVRVTFVSGLLRLKGLWDLLEAADALRNRSDIVFQIAGANPHSPQFYQSLTGRLAAHLRLAEDMEQSIAHWIQRKGLRNVRLLGHVHDVAALMRNTEILAFPSHLNGPGRSVFEAGVHGIPAVVAMRDRIEDIVVNGETGLIVPEHDPAALARAIDQLANDPALRQRLGQNAREKYLQQFDPEGAGRATLRIYRQVVAEHRGARST